MVRREAFTSQCGEVPPRRALRRGVIAETLRHRGHDLVALQDSDMTHLRGSTDEQVFDVAQRTGRVLVTENIAHIRSLADRCYPTEVTGQYVAPDAGKVTFAAYAEQWRAAQVHRPTTAAKVETTLRRHAYLTRVRGQPLRSILPSHMQAWMKGLTVDLAPSTVAVSHGIVASVFKAAVRDKRLHASPCEGTKLPEVHRTQVIPLDVETIRAIEGMSPTALSGDGHAGRDDGAAAGRGVRFDRRPFRATAPSSRPMLTVDRQLLVLAGEPP